MLDLIREIEKEQLKKSDYVSSSHEWSAPEQLDRTQWGEIGEGSDIYSIAEILFYKCISRHSTSTDYKEEFYDVVEKLKEKNTRVNPSVWSRLRA